MCNAYRGLCTIICSAAETIFPRFGQTRKSVEIHALARFRRTERIFSVINCFVNFAHISRWLSETRTIQRETIIYLMDHHRFPLGSLKRTHLIVSWAQNGESWFRSVVYSSKRRESVESTRTFFFSFRGNRTRPRVFVALTETLIEFESRVLFRASSVRTFLPYAKGKLRDTRARFRKLNYVHTCPQLLLSIFNFSPRTTVSFCVLPRTSTRHRAICCPPLYIGVTSRRKKR